MKHCYISDIVAIDEAHFLLASTARILKATKDQEIKKYSISGSINCLCHIADSIYLVGSFDGLKVWDEKND